MGAADVVRWLRENTTPRVPSTTTIVTNAGQKYERAARARRAPAPTRAARATFLLEEALPIRSLECTGSQGLQRRVGAPAHGSLDPGEQHPPGEGHAHQGQEEAPTTDGGAP